VKNDTYFWAEQFVRILLRVFARLLGSIVVAARYSSAGEALWLVGREMGDREMGEGEDSLISPPASPQRGP